MGVDATLEKPFKVETLLKMLSGMGARRGVQRRRTGGARRAASRSIGKSYCAGAMKL